MKSFNNEEPVRIAWSGHLPVEELEFEIDPIFYQLPEDLIDQRNRIWSYLRKSDPHLYNGTLFLVRKDNNHKSFDLQPITYRDFKTLQFAYLDTSDLSEGLQTREVRHPIFENYAALSVMYLICDTSNRHLLVGRRSPIGAWGDGYLACPSGLVEVSSFVSRDNLTNLTPEQYLIHEFQEEVVSDLTIRNLGLVGLLQSRNDVFTNLVLTANITADWDLDKPVQSNYEFADNILVWRTIDSIREENMDHLFGGLRFVKMTTFPDM